MICVIGMNPFLIGTQNFPRMEQLMANYCPLVNVIMHPQASKEPMHAKKQVEWRRQAYSYGMEPTITITAFPNATTKVNTTETPVTGTTATQFVNSTISQTATVSSNATIVKTSSSVMVTPSKSFTYFGNSTTMATGSSAVTGYSYGNSSTSESVSTVTEVATANVTVVISPLPFITGTAGTDAITGNATTTRTLSGVPYGNITTTRNTIYQTVTTTITPSEGCSTAASEIGVTTISTDGYVALPS